MPDETDERRSLASRRLRNRHCFAIAALVALYCATTPFSATHLDLARDIGRALAIANGESFPLQGPLLAGAMHVGPVWYYVLALPLLVVPSWIAVAFTIAVLAALKFPLAYSIGARLADPPTGLVFALLLAFPGWNAYENVFQSHTSLVATCSLAFVALTVSFARTGRPIDLAAAGVAYALALHAHPSTFAIGVLLVAAIVHRVRGGAPPRASAYVALGASLIAPFVPYLFAQARDRFSDFGAIAGYLATDRSVGDIRSVPPFLVGVFVGGPRAVAEAFASRVPFAAPIAIAVMAALCASGALGIAMLWRSGRARAWIVAAAGMLSMLAVSVVVMRGPAPFYMTYVVWVCAAALLAPGLREMARRPHLRWLGGATLAAAIAWTLVVQAGIADTLERGAYRFSMLPLFDIKQPFERGEAMPFVPAHAMKSSGERLCSEPVVTTHASLAVHLLHDYAMEARLACGRVSNILLTGDAQHASALAGLSGGTVRALHVPVEQWLGPVAIVAVARVVQPLAGAAVAPDDRYPPVPVRFGAAAAHAIRFEADAHEAVVVTNAYFTFTPAPSVAATANGRPAREVARDLVSTAYACAGCAGGEPVHWELVVDTPAVERVDIVTVRTALP